MIVSSQSRVKRASTDRIRNMSRLLRINHRKFERLEQLHKNLVVFHKRHRLAQTLILLRVKDKIVNTVHSSQLFRLCLKPPFRSEHLSIIAKDLL